ncbi:MAG: hypothetical protein ACJAX3_002461 [Patiriisocius sp.]|jgi:hypothetical protein
MLEEIIKKIKKNNFLVWFKNNFPLLTLNLIIKPLGYFRYRSEARLFSGKKVKSLTSQQSLLFFTVHKCASTLVVKIIRELSEKKEIIPIDLDGFIITHKNNNKKVFEDNKFLNQVFISKGFYYGALRYFRKVPSINEYRVFLMLRDPRDVLTSMYFSMAYSHTVLDKKMISSRESTRDLSIDEFVLSIMDSYKKKYNEYISELLGKENVLFLKYEQMVNDFPTWLNTMSLSLGIYDEKIVDELIKSNSFQNKKEDIHSHIRNIYPGDHKRKLKPETIEILNEEFESVLKILDYK